MKRDLTYFLQKSQPDDGGYYYSKDCGDMEILVCPHCKKETKNAFRMRHNISGRSSAGVWCAECGYLSAGMFWIIKKGRIVYE